MKTVKKAFLLLMALPIVCVSTVMSQSHSQPSTLKPIDTIVPDFSITASTLIDGVSQLSLQNISGLHVGVEEILREKSPQQRDDHALRFSMHLKGKSVRQILDLLCDSDARYVWTQDGDTINVFPAATRDDLSYFMNRLLQRIAVTDLESPGRALVFLEKQLPHEQLGYASGGGTSAYATPWTQSWDNITVRQFINRLSEHMGDHTSWILYGAKQERFFTFEKGGFH